MTALATLAIHWFLMIWSTYEKDVDNDMPDEDSAVGTTAISILSGISFFLTFFQFTFRIP